MVVDVTSGRDERFVASKSMAINCSHVLTRRWGGVTNMIVPPTIFILLIQYKGSYLETGRVASTAFGPPEERAGLLRSKQGGEGWGW